MHNLSLDNWIASLYNNIYHTCTRWVIPRMFSCECNNNNTDAPVNWPIWIWWTTSKKCLLVLKKKKSKKSEDKECVLQSHHCPGYSHLLSHHKFCSGEIIFSESFMLHDSMTIWTKPANQPFRHYDRQWKLYAAWKHDSMNKASQPTMQALWQARNWESLKH